MTDKESQWAPSPERRGALIRTDLKTTTSPPLHTFALTPSPSPLPARTWFPHLFSFAASYSSPRFVCLFDCWGSAPCLLLFLLIPQRYIISHSLISYCCSFRHSFFTRSPPCDRFSCHSLCLINIHPRIFGLALVSSTVSLLFRCLNP